MLLFQILAYISYSIQRAKMMGVNVFDLAIIFAFLVGFLICVAKVKFNICFIFVFVSIKLVGYC